MTKSFLRAILGAAILFGCAVPPERVGAPLVPAQDTSAVQLYNDGLSYRAQSRLQDAEGAFRQARVLFPKAANVKESLAQTLIEQRLTDEGRSLYRELLTAFPEKVELFMGIASSEATSGNYEEALRWYQQALDRTLEKGAFDRAATIARAMATVLFRVGREREALCSSDLAYQLRPNPDELQRHVRILAALNRFSAASSLIETALSGGGEREPRIISLYALSRFGEDRVAEARLLADEAQQIAPREVRSEMEQLAAVLWGDDAAVEDPEHRAEILLLPLPDDAELYWPVKLLARYQERQRAKEGA